MPGSALVLGGGGVSGIAWMTGLLFGMSEGDFSAADFDRLIGTSAGSAVAAQLASGIPLDRLYARQAQPGGQTGELKPDLNWWRLIRGIVPALLVRRDTTRFRQRIGRMALTAGAVDPAVRRAVIADRLMADQWPDQNLQILAIDARSGELRAFDRDSGISLVDAVAASCAVPGVWPTIEIQGRPYMDGGLPSPENLQQAEDADRVLLIAPLGRDRRGRTPRRLQLEIDGLLRKGVRVDVIVPDDASRRAMGRNALDPANRAPSAEAGLRQGRRQAAR